MLTNADEQAGASTEGAGGSSGSSSNPGNDATTKTAAATDPTQPTPEEILDQYQVSDAETTNWPGAWDPLRFVVDQKVVTEKEAELLNGLGPPFELNAFKGIHDDAFSVADERFPPSEDRNDDQNDAFRHAYWNALMVKEFGADWQRIMPRLTNSSPGNPLPARPWICTTMKLGATWPSPIRTPVLRSLQT